MELDKYRREWHEEAREYFLTARDKYETACDEGAENCSCMLELIFNEMGKKVYSYAEYWVSVGEYDKAKDFYKDAEEYGYDCFEEIEYCNEKEYEKNY